MAYDLEEQESLEQLKAWWEKWGTAVTVVITVACLAFAGWNGWNWYRQRQGAQATVAYIQLQNAFLENDTSNIASLADGIMKNYPRHVFAPLAAFYRASAAAEAKDYDAARTALSWVLSSGHKDYEMPARLRLAKVELDDGKGETALAVLSAIKPAEGEEVIYLDRLGDVHAALGHVDDARRCWTEARQADHLSNTLTPLLTLKLEALPAGPEAATP